MTTLDDIITAVFKPQRMFGNFVAQVVIEEVHTDELTITEHPVEQGAAISDHAFKRPAELILRMGWSNSAVAAGLTSLGGLAQLASSDLAGDINYMITVYNNLLKLQESRIPFKIVTGKRTYQNMLCRSLSVPTRADTEHALMVTAICREVILVQTQASNLPNASVQSNSAQNAPPIDQGVVQPQNTTKQLNATTMTVQ